MVSRPKTIGEVQQEIELALSRLSSTPVPAGLEGLKYLVPPHGTCASVALCRIGSQRERIRSDANATYWNPRVGKAVISFEENESPNLARNSAATTETGPLDDLVSALDGAERDSRYREFVGIKSFRDQYLSALGYAWAVDPAGRQEVIAKAIDLGIVFRTSVPNPKDPAFPTTAIRLSRDNVEVKRVLRANASARSVFKPIAIRGERLSSTILNNRR